MDPVGLRDFVIEVVDLVNIKFIASGEHEGGHDGKREAPLGQPLG